MSLNELESAARDLSEDEQLELVERVMASMQMTPETQVAWLVEAEQRWDDMKSGEVQPIPADQVIAEIRQKLHEQRRVSSRSKS